MLADPFGLPHVAGVVEVIPETLVGSVTATVVIVVHPRASVVVTEYEPAERPDKFELVEPPRDQLYA